MSCVSVVIFGVSVVIFGIAIKGGVTRKKGQKVRAGEKIEQGCSTSIIYDIMHYYWSDVDLKLSSQ